VTSEFRYFYYLTFVIFKLLGDFCFIWISKTIFHTTITKLKKLQNDETNNLEDETWLLFLPVSL